MKKLFGGVGGGGRRRVESEDESGNTLDRLVRDKEGVRRRLEDEEKEFILRKREYVTNIIHIEKQEIERRGKELAKKKEALQEKKRLNQQVKDKYVEQMALLAKKLEEVKQEHLRVESELEGDIVLLEDKLSQVQMSLQEKVGEGDVDPEPSAPEVDRDLPLYPDLYRFRTPSMGSKYRSTGSTGSSPQISITSTTSANSAKSDSDS